MARRPERVFHVKRSTVIDRVPPEMRQHIRWSDRGKWVSKVKYPDRATAQRHARALYAKDGRHVEPYRCGFCGAWHVGRSRGMDRFDGYVFAMELGVRCLRNLQGENYFDRDKRLRTIKSRCVAAQRRGRMAA